MKTLRLTDSGLIMLMKMLKPNDSKLIMEDQVRSKYCLFFIIVHIVVKGNTDIDTYNKYI